MTLTEQETRPAERWAAAFAEGWRAPRSADAFADHFEPWFTDDVRRVQPQLPDLVGKRAFRERFARPLFALVPDLHATVRTWAGSGDVSPSAWLRFLRTQLVQRPGGAR
jgi:hypothetical protein